MESLSGNIPSLPKSSPPILRRLLNYLKIPVVKIKKGGKKSLLLIPGVLLLILVGVVLFYILMPVYPPQNLGITNLTDHQAVLSWVTKRPTESTIILADSKGGFPVLPAFSKNLHKDDYDKQSLILGKYATHYVTIPNLEPNREYKYRIYEGIKKVFEGRFVTIAPTSALPAPDPVYGTVYLSDGQTPAPGIMVYLRIASNDIYSGTLSALTNPSGKWSIDLSNLRSIDLKESFVRNPDKYVAQVMVEGGTLGRFKIAADQSTMRPFPNILLKSQ